MALAASSRRSRLETQTVSEPEPGGGAESDRDHEQNRTSRSLVDQRVDETRRMHAPPRTWGLERGVRGDSRRHDGGGPAYGRHSIRRARAHSTLRATHAVLHRIDERATGAEGNSREPEPPNVRAEKRRRDPTASYGGLVCHAPRSRQSLRSRLAVGYRGSLTVWGLD